MAGMTQQQPATDARSGPSAGAMFAAVLGAILVALLLVVAARSLFAQDDALVCETRNAERVMDGLEAQPCP